MDYEKAYKESFEAAKGLHEAGNALTKKQMEIVFPQLAESEDERIRKWIANYIHRGVFDEEEYPKALKAIEWLEKQKEQKPAEKQDYSGLSNLERVIHRGFLAAGLEDVPVTIIKETAKECVAQMKPAEWDGYTKTNLDRALQIIKDAKGKLQGYQSDDGIYECDKAIECLEHFLYRGLEIEKPAEWSEEDNIGWDEAFACVTKTERAAKDEGELQNAVTAEKWLKEIKFKYYVHPNREWSEDDEETLKDIIAGLEATKQLTYRHEPSGRACYNKWIAWLKSLRPQSKQEWDANDKAIVNCIVCCLDGKFVPEAARKQSLEWFNKHRRDFLNIHFWKPSEEQLVTLLRAEGIVRVHDTKELAAAIAELYEQLKRLHG